MEFDLFGLQHIARFCLFTGLFREEIFVPKKKDPHE